MSFSKERCVGRFAFDIGIVNCFSFSLKLFVMGLVLCFGCINTPLGC